MPLSLSAAEILNREFLEVRARLLQIAASLDRLNRAQGDVDDDPRLVKIRQALAILQEDRPHSAEKIQLLFSREYEENWRTKFGLKSKTQDGTARPAATS